VIAEPISGCWFCGKLESEVKKLFHGPGVNICDECVRRGVEILTEEGIDLSPARAADTPHWRAQHGFPSCSFCGKRQGQVRRLLKGPIIRPFTEVFICDECISTCIVTLADRKAT